MTRPVFSFALSAGLLGLLSSVPFGAAIERIPVTASFRCGASLSSLAADPCGTGDRMAGGGGLYQGIPIARRTTPQGAYITDYGTFWFVHPAGTPRAAFFDFTDRVALPQPPVVRSFGTTWSSALQPNWLGTPIGPANGMWGLRQGDVVEGTLKADFRRANDTYLWTLRFNAASYAGTTNLRFACLGEANNQCNHWRIEADASDVALLQASTTSGKQVTYDEGTYRMPFAIDVSYP